MLKCRKYMNFVPSSKKAKRMGDNTKKSSYIL